MDNYNYPEGSDTEDAIWNELYTPTKEIEVTVSVTLSKTIKLEVDCLSNEENSYNEGYLKEEIEKQYILPQEANEYVPLHTWAYKDLSDWNVDDYTVIEE